MRLRLTKQNLHFFAISVHGWCAPLGVGKSRSMGLTGDQGERKTMSEQLLDGYVSRTQLAKELGKTLRTIDRWEMRRIGPPRVVVGRMILYRRESVREWLLSRELQQREGKDRRPGHNGNGAMSGSRRHPARRL